MSNFMKVSSESAPRVELHEKLGLTGAEVEQLYNQKYKELMKR